MVEKREDKNEEGKVRKTYPCITLLVLRTGTYEDTLRIKRRRKLVFLNARILLWGYYVNAARRKLFLPIYLVLEVLPKKPVSICHLIILKR